MNFFQPGSCEPLKMAVHGAIGGLACVCVLYNACSFLTRRTPHLGVNVVLYGLLVALEIEHVKHHAASCR